MKSGTARFLLGAFVVVLLTVTTLTVYRTVQIGRIKNCPEPFDVEEFIRSRQLESETNAYPSVVKAIALLSPHPAMNVERWRSLRGQISDVEVDGWTAATAEVRDFLDGNRSALGKFITAVGNAHFFQVPAAGGEKTPDHDPQFVYGCDALTALANLEAERLLAAKDAIGSLQLLLANLHFSRLRLVHADKQQLIAALVTYRNAIHFLSKWSHSDSADANDLRRLLAELPEESVFGTVRSQAIKFEYLAHRMAKHRVPSGSISISTVGPSIRNWLSGEPEVSDRVMRHTYANLLSEADNHPHLRSGVVDSKARVIRPTASNMRRPGSGLPPHWVAFAGGHPGFLKGVELCRAAEAHAVKDFRWLTGFAIISDVDEVAVLDDLLRVELALQLYIRETKSLPKALAELQPTYLHELPRDPFGNPGDHIRFEESNGNWYVYSVGRDGVDGRHLWGKFGTQPDDIRLKLVRP